MVQAAARGIVDFRRARLLDPHWWTGLGLLLNETAAENAVRLAEASQRHHLTLLGRAREAAAAKRQLEHAIAGYETIHRRLYPWQEAPTRLQEADALTDAWSQAFGGRPDDPQMAAKIEITARELRRVAAETRKANEKKTRKS